MSLLLPILKSATPERHQKAVHGLQDGSLTVTITKQSERETRALVRNGTGEYGVTLTEHGPFCSCKDALYRGTICKHALAVAIFSLQPHAPVDEKIHLMWDSGEILCGHSLTSSTRWWQRWTLNALNWSDIVCQPCVHTWTHPTSMKAAA